MHIEERLRTGWSNGLRNVAGKNLMRIAENNDYDDDISNDMVSKMIVMMITPL